MRRAERKRKLVGPWRRLHGAVWLIGLAILFWRGWIWPGILVLLAISAVIEAVLLRYAPAAFEDAEPASSPSPLAAAPATPSPTSPAPEHRFELLPSVCPKCGGPIRGAEVKWTGPQSADCPYCGANLPMMARSGPA